MDIRKVKEVRMYLVRRKIVSDSNLDNIFNV